MWSQKRVYSHVRNSSAVHKQGNIVWTQVEKDINTGVLILRTVDLTVCSRQSHLFLLKMTKLKLNNNDKQFSVCK